MWDDIWHSRFIEALYKRYPKRTELVQELMDLLHIEREAIYRRLRKDVKFSFHEVAKISSAWDIPFNWILNNDIEQVALFQMRIVNFLSPTKKDMDFIQTRIQYLNYINTFGDSEYMDICNRLPKSLITGFENLYRFDLFKWAYEYGSDKEAEKAFSQIVIPKELQEVMVKYFQSIRNVTSMSYIWDQMIIDRLVRDIQYFHSIQMITDDEKELIRQDMYALLDYLFETVSKGYYIESRCEVNFYISWVSINTNYSYLYTEEAKICRIHAFNKYEVYTLDPQMINKFRAWMQLKKRSCVLISKAGKKERIEFFTKQRQLVDSL
jgi:hypothetical protein